MANVFEATVTATFDDVAGGNFQRLFDFSNGETVDQIWLGNVANTATIALEVFQNGTRYRLEVPGAIDEGIEATWNVTIDDTGTFTIIKDSIQIATANFGVGAVPNDVPRTENLIGESSFGGDDPLIGTVRSIDVETTLTNGFDIGFSDTQNTVGSFDGTDRAEVLNASSSTGADSLAGDGGDDSIFGGGGDDTLSGDTGNDLVIGGAGADSIDGGVGDDTLYGDDFLADPVTVTNSGFDAGSTGWTTTGAGTFVANVDGNNAMAFNAGNNGTGGTAQQTIATQAGGRYELSLDAFEFDVSGGAANHTLLIQVIDANGQVIAEQTEVVADETVRTITVDFIAISDSVTLRFSNPTSTGTNDSDLMIDNVSVTPVAPTGGGDDTLSGGAGNDALFGGAGNDSVAAGDGNDTVEGGAGDDNISAFQGDDSITGGDGADTIFSLGGGNDTIDGGADADTIIIRTLSDATVRGGEATTTGTDTDRLDVAEGTTALTLDFSGAEAGTIGDGASTVTFTEIEQVFLGEGDDTINTGAQTDGLTVDGGGGDDVFNAAISSGANTFFGQGGNDTIFGGSGSETLGGGSGSDLIHGRAGADLINAGGDADRVYGGSGNDTIDGAQDDDLIDGGSGEDFILGGDGSDTITGGTGADSIQGGGDADTFLLSDGFGNDTIGGGETATTGTDSDVLDFSAVTASGVTLHLSAREGGTVTDGIGSVLFTEIETFVLTDQNDVVDATLDGSFLAGNYSLDLGGGNDLFQSWGTDSAGNSNVDTVFGGAGNDTISSGGADDLIYGGDGDDLISSGFANNGSGDTVFGGEGNDTINSIEGSTGTNSGVGDYVDGGTGNDSITGTNDALDIYQGDTLIGGEGDDTIAGLSGSDSLFGGADGDLFVMADNFGNDTIGGGETATTGSDSDVIDASAIIGTGVTVNVANESGTLRDGTDTVTFSEIEGFILTDQNDTFTAFGTSAVTVNSGAGNDFIREGNGRNTIDAGTGSDTIVSGLGTSTITGGEDVDGGDIDVLDFGVADDAVTITFDGAESGTYADDDGDSGTFSEIELFKLTSGNDSVDASLDTAGVVIDGGGGADTIIGGSGDDVITGGGPVSGDPGDSLSGGAGDDIILGDAGADTIDGGTGNDFIEGGVGNDLLTGGEGDDYFTYTPGDGLDTITDFNTGNTGTLEDGDLSNNDFIDLSGYYDHISELYADQADDGVLNQSNTTDTRGNAVDYSNNIQFDTNGTPNDEGIRFTGATADRSFFTVENTGVVCFTSGTLIATPKGEVPIETLKPGDLVLTRDNGPQPLIWIGQRRVGRSELVRNKNLRPIEIKPTLIRSHSPLVVSRQHGVLVRRDGEETLIRAIHLARLPRSGARIMHGCRGVTYIHLMFDAHQIVFSAGAPSESFYPGRQAISSLAAAARDELLTLFPTLPRERARDFAPFRELGEAVLQGA